MKWETCFLCGYDVEVNLFCFARNEKLTLKFEKYCKNCPYYMTTREARNKILFALGLKKHINK